MIKESTGFPLKILRRKNHLELAEICLRHVLLLLHRLYKIESFTARVCNNVDDVITLLHGFRSKLHCALQILERFTGMFLPYLGDFRVFRGKRF